MSYEEFLELKRKYRVCCEWNDELTEFNPDSAFIICDNHRTQISYKNENTFGVLSFGREKYKKALEELGVPYEYSNNAEGVGTEHEYFIDFKYLDKCIHVFKPKKSPKNFVYPFSRRNITTWLRFCRNVDEEYYDKKLKEYISKEGDE